MPWRAASAALTNVTGPSFGTSHTQRVLALAWALSANGNEIARVAIPTLTCLFIFASSSAHLPAPHAPFPVGGSKCCLVEGSNLVPGLSRKRAAGPPQALGGSGP